jgi:hypothetical protein
MRLHSTSVGMSPQGNGETDVDERTATARSPQKARLREKTSTKWIRGLSTGVGEIAFPNPRWLARACKRSMSSLKLIPASPEVRQGLGTQSLAQQSLLVLVEFCTGSSRVLYRTTIFDITFSLNK